jgi:phosphoglycerate dehydrogenase-like enzyme
MADSRPKVLLACNQHVRHNYLAAADIERLEGFADWDWFECEGGGIYDTNEDPATAKKLGDRLGDFDGLVVCHGCPTVDAAILDRASGLKIVGELEGDRFASRVDVEAAWERDICTVDTTNGSSYPVAEWALALIVIALRNAGAHFRRILAGDVSPAAQDDFGYIHGDLTGKRVGLIGCGHIGRRLIQFLRPFATEIWVYDPYLAREMADVVGFLKTSLDNVLSQCDAIVCLAPHTPRTEGMIGRRELDLIRSGSVLVNVSRGKVIDSAALVARLKRGDIVAALDVFDPDVYEENAYGDKEIIQLENVFLSPHIAGVTAASYPRFFKLMVDEFDRFFHGHETLFDLTPRSIANRRGSESTD